MGSGAVDDGQVDQRMWIRLPREAQPRAGEALPRLDVQATNAPVTVPCTTACVTSAFGTSLGSRVISTSSRRADPSANVAGSRLPIRRAISDAAGWAVALGGDRRGGGARVVLSGLTARGRRDHECRQNQRADGHTSFTPFVHASDNRARTPPPALNMQLVANQELVRNRVRIGLGFHLGALAVFAIGLAMSLTTDTTRELHLTAWGAIVFGLVLYSVGQTQLRRWGPRNRQEEPLGQAIRGLDDRYKLYAFLSSSLPDYILVSPAGAQVLIVRSDAGDVTCKADQWRSPAAAWAA